MEDEKVKEDLKTAIERTRFLLENSKLFRGDKFLRATMARYKQKLDELKQRKEAQDL